MNISAPGITGDLLSRKDKPMAAAPVTAETWIQGTLIAGDADIRAAGKAMEKSSDDVREGAQKEKREPAALMSLAAQSRSMAAEGPPVQVMQRPVSELPRNQMHAKQTVAQVQTVFRSNADGLIMVLYSDSLRGSDDFRQAWLQTISEDSIVLRIGNQRIGYRLPPGLSAQLSNQLKKSK
jgi:hypothetical protein